MLLYLFFDSLLSICPEKMKTEKWPKAADSPLRMCICDMYVCEIGFFSVILMQLI